MKNHIIIKLLILFTFFSVSNFEVYASEPYSIPMYRVTDKVEIKSKKRYNTIYQYKDYTVNIFKYEKKDRKNKFEIIIYNKQTNVYSKNDFSGLGELLLFKDKGSEYFLINSWQGERYFGDDIHLFKLLVNGNIKEIIMKNISSTTGFTGIDDKMFLTRWNDHFFEFYDSGLYYKDYYEFKNDSFVLNNEPFRQVYFALYKKAIVDFEKFSFDFDKDKDVKVFMNKFVAVLTYGFLSKNNKGVEDFFDKNKYYLKLFDLIPEEFYKQFLKLFKSLKINDQ